MSNADVAETLRQRFIEEFGYKHAHGWPIYDRQGSQRIMYHMVHASDHDEAPNLMSRAYKTATRRAEPREQFTFEFERFDRFRRWSSARQTASGSGSTGRTGGRGRPRSGHRAILGHLPGFPTDRGAPIRLLDLVVFRHSGYQRTQAWLPRTRDTGSTMMRPSWTDTRT